MLFMLRQRAIKHVSAALSRQVRLVSGELKPKNVLFLGTPQFAADSLKLFLEYFRSNGTQYKMIGAVAQPAVTVGKKRIATPVEDVCTNLGLPVLTPESAKDPEFIDKLKSLDIDLCITAAYGNYLPKAFLSIPRFGTVNIHPSLLPKYRGAAPLQRCLEAGERETAVTLLYTVAKMDAGPVIKQIKIPLTGDETASELLPRCFAIGTTALFELLPSIFDGTVAKTPQDEAQATPAPKIEAAEGLVDCGTMSAVTLHNRCRAFSEWPGIYTYLSFDYSASKPWVKEPEVKRIKIVSTRLLPVELAPSHAASDPRRLSLVQVEGKPVIALRCGDGSLLGIEKLQPVGKPVTDAKSFINGLQKVNICRWEVTAVHSQTDWK